MTPTAFGYPELESHAASEGSKVLVIAANMRQRSRNLRERRKAFLADLGIEESGLDLLIKAGYSLLGLIIIHYRRSKEVRAWTVRNGTKAPQVAGKFIPISSADSSAPR